MVCMPSHRLFGTADSTVYIGAERWMRCTRTLAIITDKWPNDKGIFQLYFGH